MSLEHFATAADVLLLGPKKIVLLNSVFLLFLHIRDCKGNFEF